MPDHAGRIHESLQGAAERASGADPLPLEAALIGVTVGSYVEPAPDSDPDQLVGAAEGSLEVNRSAVSMLTAELLNDAADR